MYSRRIRIVKYLEGRSLLCPGTGRTCKGRSVTRRQIEGRRRRTIEGVSARKIRKRHCNSSIGDGGRNSSNSSDYNKGKPEGDRTTDRATDRATRFRQIVDKIPTEIGRQSTGFRQRSVTMVTITKESPRATGRNNSGDRYRNKNKDKSNGDLAANQARVGSIPQETV